MRMTTELEKRSLQAIEKETAKQYLSSEVRFYTVQDLVKMLGWPELTVKRMFNDPQFPSADYGRLKVVEAHALIAFFSVKHRKVEEKYWEGDGKRRA